MFNKQDRKCATVQLMLSTDLSYDNRTIASTLKMQIRTVQRLRAQLNASDDPLEVVEQRFQVRAISCHLTSSKLAWKSTPKCTWMCWRVWWSLGVAAWLGTGPKVRTDPGSASEGVLRLCTFLSLAPLLPWPEPARLLRLVIHWEYHQHDLPQHQSRPNHRHPPSIRQAPAGTCKKGMLPVPDPYQGGDWGWRRLHWIDVSSTT